MGADPRRREPDVSSWRVGPSWDRSGHPGRGQPGTRSLVSVGRLPQGLAGSQWGLALPIDWPWDPPPGGLFYRVAKEGLDLGCTLLVMPLALVVMGLLAIAIMVDSSGAPLYRQWRVGKGGLPFRIWKLRTMVPGADRLGPALTGDDDPRVTRLGRFIRRWSLDEVPQLFNVLAGQMSLVGPRPELPSIVAVYTREQTDVLKVKPGLTGLSQVNGRDDLNIHAKLDIDRRYVYSRSIGMDFRIMLATVPVVFRGTGIKR